MWGPSRGRVDSMLMEQCAEAVTTCLAAVAVSCMMWQHGAQFDRNSHADHEQAPACMAEAGKMEVQLPREGMLCMCAQGKDYVSCCSWNGSADRASHAKCMGGPEQAQRKRKHTCRLRCCTPSATCNAKQASQSVKLGNSHATAGKAAIASSPLRAWTARQGGS